MNLILITFMLYLILNFLNPFKTISYDEAYYWVYSNKFELSYCSKPPMLSWLLILTKKIFTNKFYHLRVMSFILDLIFVVLSLFIIPFKSNNLLLLISSYFFLFKKYLYTTDSVLAIGNLLTIGSLYNLLCFKMNIYWIGITIGTIYSIYSKQMGLILPLVILFYTGLSNYYLFYLIISGLFFLPMYLNDSKNNNALVNHTVNSNLTNNVTKPSLINLLHYIVEQIFFVSPIIIYILYYHLVNIEFKYISIYPLIICGFLSIFKRINTNWTSIFWTNLILFSKFNNFNKNLLFYNILSFLVISLILKFTNLSVRRKTDIYPEIMKELEYYQNIFKIDRFCFISCRKEGSYLWFYLNQQPIKLYTLNPPEDQFDIWNLNINDFNKLGLLLNDHDVKQRIENFEIIKEINLKHNHKLIIYQKLS